LTDFRNKRPHSRVLIGVEFQDDGNASARDDEHVAITYGIGIRQCNGVLILNPPAARVEQKGHGMTVRLIVLMLT
jgi:hypothetical protein